MEKKGQAKVITIVLIILIVLVAMVILWNVVLPLIREKSEEVDLTGFVTSLEITDVIVFEHGVSHVSVNRKTGGELDGLRFVFYDAVGNAKTRDQLGLEELETKIYYFSAFEDFGEIKSVSVAPIVNGKIGIESESKTSEILKLPSGLVSWWRFSQGLNDLAGVNNCALSEKNYDCGPSESLSFNNQIGISFWVENNSGLIDLIGKGDNYKVILDNNLINFSYNNESVQGLNELEQGWNHVVISVGKVSNIYINDVIDSSIEVASLIPNLNRLIISQEVDNLMIFNRSLSLIDVNAFYSYQKSYFE